MLLSGCLTLDPKLDHSAAPNSCSVIPAQAGVQKIFVTRWIPAPGLSLSRQSLSREPAGTSFAGMTDEYKENRLVWMDK